MDNQELIKLAYKTMENAYAPYSGFKVGAALYTGKEVYTGCNIENASYGATICAERCAISKAISEGALKFEKIAIVSSSGNFTPPCGICLQTILEFMPDGIVVLTDNIDIREYKVSELIPTGFSFSKTDVKGL